MNKIAATCTLKTKTLTYASSDGFTSLESELPIVVLSNKFLQNHDGFSLFNSIILLPYKGILYYII